MKPAPTEARASLTGSRQPAGAPLSFGSEDSDSWVFAMQTGRPPNPLRSKASSCLAAAGE